MEKFTSHSFLSVLNYFGGLLSWLICKEPACQSRNHGFDPWEARIPCSSKQLSPCIPSIKPVLVAQRVNRLLAMQETWVRSLGQEDPLEKEMQPTPVLLPGKFHGWRSLVGYRLWDHKESATTRVRENRKPGYRDHLLSLSTITVPSTPCWHS